MDPSTKQIMDDIYKYFSSKPMTINEINVGVTIKENEETKKELGGRRYRRSEFEEKKHNKKSFLTV